MGAQGFCEGIALLAAIPCAAIPCSLELGPALAVSAALSAIIWATWPHPSRKTLRLLVALASAFLLAFCIVLPRPAGDEVIMLDVGQGDAIIVRSRGATILIDTGNQDAKLLEALARNGVFSLDALVVTHPDDDHCGSLPALKGIVRIGTVCVAEDLLTCPCDACSELKHSVSATVGEQALEGLAVGDTLSVGALTLEVIWPDMFHDEGGNGDSLTLLMRSDFDGNGAAEWTGLLCGDAENEQLVAMVEANRLGNIDLYKVGHHGSKAAIDEKTAQVLTPSISLVSAGENNRYGHPASQTLDVLESVGSVIERTDQKGDVVCKMTTESITVGTLR
ncbi:MAG: MBL fold metallo-hydrolase [Raoultibacter sp.]